MRRPHEVTAISGTRRPAWDSSKQEGETVAGGDDTHLRSDDRWGRASRFARRPETPQPRQEVKHAALELSVSEELFDRVVPENLIHPGTGDLPAGPTRQHP